jgi:hypothetical protein
MYLCTSPKVIKAHFSSNFSLYLINKNMAMKLWKQFRCPTTDEWIKNIKDIQLGAGGSCL